jgi:hypothetical protein
VVLKKVPKGASVAAACPFDERLFAGQIAHEGAKRLDVFLDPRVRVRTKLFLDPRQRARTNFLGGAVAHGAHATRNGASRPPVSAVGREGEEPSVPGRRTCPPATR